jgi:high-affinity iron transporter
MIPAWGYQLWDTSWLLSEDSLVGRAFQAMVGYSDRPMGVQLVAWLAVLTFMVVGARLVRTWPERAIVRRRAFKHDTP